MRLQDFLREGDVIQAAHRFGRKLKVGDRVKAHNNPFWMTVTKEPNEHGYVGVRFGTAGKDAGPYHERELHLHEGVKKAEKHHGEMVDHLSAAFQVKAGTKRYHWHMRHVKLAAARKYREAVKYFQSKGDLEKASLASTKHKELSKAAARHFRLAGSARR